MVSDFMSAHARTPAAARSHPSALRHRKNVQNLNARQLKALGDGFRKFQELTDDRGYGYWAGLHGLPLPYYCQHGSRLFLPWHRAYLYFVELALRDREPQAGLTWWDWTSIQSHTTGVPEPFAVRRVGSGANPLYSAVVPPVARQGGQPRVTTRSPRAPGELPTAAEIEAIVDLPDFLDFSLQLENVHNRIHGWVGGTMGIVAWAAYDPLFWAHHTMIDRLWRLWQLRHPRSGMPESMLHQALAPFSLTVADVLDVKALGYGYASSSTHAVVR